MSSVMSSAEAEEKAERIYKCKAKINSLKATNRSMESQIKANLKEIERIEKMITDLLQVPLPL